MCRMPSRVLHDVMQQIFANDMHKLPDDRNMKRKRKEKYFFLDIQNVKNMHTYILCF